MDTEKIVTDLVEFWKKTQKVNIFLLRRIAAHAEMSNRMMSEALMHIREENLSKIDVWFRQEYKKTSQGLRDKIFEHFGPDLNWDEILPYDGDIRPNSEL